LSSTLYEYCLQMGRAELAGEWDAEKNGELSSACLSYGSKKKVWWRCAKGHVWQARILSRVDGAGCPVCTGKAVAPGENDMASLFPQLAAEWHPTKNGALRPEEVLPFSNRKVSWLCAKGHEWESSIAHRTKHSSGCPYCTNKKVLAGFNDLATLQREVAEQWHPTLNGALTPEMITPGSAKKVWWQCSEGHVWQAHVFSRTGADKCGCPVCAGKVNKKLRGKYTDIIEAKTR